MGSTFRQILPLVIGAAISPVLLLLQVATLASKNFPLRRALLVLVSSSMVTALIIIFVSSTNQKSSSSSGSQDAVHAWIEIVLAVVLLANAVRSMLAPASDAEVKAPPDESSARLHAVRYLLLGVAAMATNFTTIVLLIPAVHDVAISSLSTQDKATLLVVVGIIVEFVAYFPILVVLAAGKKGPVLLDHLSTYLRTHRRRIGIVVSLGFAIYLGYSGLSALA